MDMIITIWYWSGFTLLCCGVVLGGAWAFAGSVWWAYGKIRRMKGITTLEKWRRAWYREQAVRLIPHPFYHDEGSSLHYRLERITGEQADKFKVSFEGADVGTYHSLSEAIEGMLMDSHDAWAAETKQESDHD